MPTLKLTKSVIDDLGPRAADQVYWDKSLPGFGLKVTPAGRKVFIVMYRTTDSRRQLRKYTLGHLRRPDAAHGTTAAQKVLLARLDGKDPAAEKQESPKAAGGIEHRGGRRPLQGGVSGTPQVGQETAAFSTGSCCSVEGRARSPKSPAPTSGTASTRSFSAAPLPWPGGPSR